MRTTHIHILISVISFLFMLPLLPHVNLYRYFLEPWNNIVLFNKK